MTILLLAIIYLAFISLGLPDSILGASWPVMHLELGAELEQAGLISMTIAAGTIVSSLLSQRLVAKLKTYGVTTLCIGVTALFLFLFSRATSIYQLLLFAFPLGLGAGSIDAALNNYVALHYKAKHMNFLHCFWGVGTIVGPAILTALITTGGSWKNAYLYVSMVQTAIMVIVALSLPLWKKMDKGVDSSEKQEKQIRIYSTKELLRVRGVPAALIAYLAYCGYEATAFLWSASYMVYGKGFSAAEGASLAGITYLGITAGRFVNGFLASKFNDKTLIRMGQVEALIALLVLMFIPGKITAYLGLFFLGFGAGPIYPCLMHETVEYFDVKYSQGIIGLQMAAAYIGSTFCPPLYGLIANATTLKLLPFFVLILYVIQVIATEAKNRQCGK